MCFKLAQVMSRKQFLFFNQYFNKLAINNYVHIYINTCLSSIYEYS